MLVRKWMFSFGLMWIVEGGSLRSELFATFTSSPKSFSFGPDFGGNPAEQLENLLPDDKKGEVSDLKKCFTEKSCGDDTIESLSKTLPMLVVGLKSQDAGDVVFATSSVIAGLFSVFPETATAGAFLNLATGLANALFGGGSTSQSPPVTLASFQELFQSIMSDELDENTEEGATYDNIYKGCKDLYGANKSLAALFTLIQYDYQWGRGSIINEEHIHCLLGEQGCDVEIKSLYEISERINSAQENLRTAANTWNDAVNSLLKTGPQINLMKFMCTAVDVPGLQSPCYQHIAHPNLHMWDCNDDMTLCKLRTDNSNFDSAFLKNYNLNDHYTPCGIYHHQNECGSDFGSQFNDCWSQEIDTNCVARLKEVDSCVQQYQGGGGPVTTAARHVIGPYKSVVMRFLILSLRVLHYITDPQKKYDLLVSLEIQQKALNLATISLQNGCDMQFQDKSVYNTPRMNDKYHDDDCSKGDWIASNKAKDMCETMKRGNWAGAEYLKAGSWLDYNIMNLTNVFNFYE